MERDIRQMEQTRSESHSIRRAFFHTRVLAVLSLFLSSGTLLCCALPAVLATLVGGAAVVSLVSTFPWLITLSQYKSWIFLGAGILLGIQGLLIYRMRGRSACEIGEEGCQIVGRFTRRVFWMALSIYVIGAFFAYGLTPLLRWLEG